MFLKTFLKVFAITTILGTNAQAGTIGTRIVGGEDADIADFPYQVAILYIDTHLCGGSIIQPNVILSAAHCFVGITAENLLVRAGSSHNYEGGQLAAVSLIIQHNQYDDTTHDYDISILKLSQSLVYGTGVKAITLPPQNTVFEGDAIATGWGRLWSEGPVPTQLQKVVIPLLSRDICDLVYGDRITGNMICGGYVAGGKDTCQGDSGGPLALNGFLVGITSWGDGCAAANSPGVYTQVSVFRDYIDNIVNII